MTDAVSCDPDGPRHTVRPCPEPRDAGASAPARAQRLVPRGDCAADWTAGAAAPSATRRTLDARSQADPRCGGRGAARQAAGARHVDAGHAPPHDRRRFPRLRGPLQTGLDRGLARSSAVARPASRWRRSSPRPGSTSVNRGRSTTFAIIWPRLSRRPTSARWPTPSACSCPCCRFRPRTPWGFPAQADFITAEAWLGNRRRAPAGTAEDSSALPRRLWSGDGRRRAGAGQGCMGCAGIRDAAAEAGVVPRRTRWRAVRPARRAAPGSRRAGAGAAAARVGQRDRRARRRAPARRSIGPQCSSPGCACWRPFCWTAVSSAPGRSSGARSGGAERIPLRAAGAARRESRGEGAGMLEFSEPESARQRAEIGSIISLRIYTI